MDDGSYACEHGVWVEATNERGWGGVVCGMCGMCGMCR